MANSIGVRSATVVSLSGIINKVHHTCTDKRNALYGISSLSKLGEAGRVCTVCGFRHTRKTLQRMKRSAFLSPFSCLPARRRWHSQLVRMTINVDGKMAMVSIGLNGIFRYVQSGRPLLAHPCLPALKGGEMSNDFFCRRNYLKRYFK